MESSCSACATGHLQRGIGAAPTGGKVRNAITFRSPVTGRDREALGMRMRFMPERTVSHRRLPRCGARRRIQQTWLAYAPAKARNQGQRYPEKAFAGKVAFVYPTVTPETRTARVPSSCQQRGCSNPTFTRMSSFGTGERA